MMKRLVWFVSGAVAGIAGAGFAKRKAREAVEELAPTAVARRTVRRVRDAISEGRTAARVREAELRAQLARHSDRLEPIADLDDSKVGSDDLTYKCANLW